MAANWKLPAVYVVENNGWGEFTPTEFVIPVKDIATRAGSYAMASAIADGMDFFDVYAKAGEAIARARRGDGPTLLECKTYRYYGHYVGDPLTYRTKEEVEQWRRRDALALFEARTVAEGVMEPGNLRRIDAEVVAEIAAAVEAAEQAPVPEATELVTDVYVNG
jgi:pyruvate dehydrogenase E1 component alpha subunit